MPWNLGLAWANGELATFRIFWFPAIFETACVLSCLQTTQKFPFRKNLRLVFTGEGVGVEVVVGVSMT